MVRSVLILLACAVGCYSPSLHDCVVRCGPEGQCAEGLSCVAGMCRLEGETLACGVESETCGVGGCQADETCATCSADCGSCMPRCGSTALLTDSFMTPGAGPLWVPGETAAGGAIEMDGELVLKPGAGGSAAYISQVVHDLRDGRIAVEVTGMVDPSKPALAALLVVATSGLTIRVLQLAGMLYFDLDSTSDALAKVAYDPTEHRHWRLREHDGWTYWETSPNATTWTVQASAPDPTNLSAVSVIMIAVGSDEPGEQGAFRVGHVQGGDGQLPYCPASNILETFDASPTGLRHVEDKGCSFLIENNRMILRPEPTVTGSVCYADFIVPHDFRGGGSITFDIEAIPSGPGTASQIALVYDRDNYIGFTTIGKDLYIGSVLNGMESTPQWLGPYDPAQHRFWRLREMNGGVLVQTAGSDGMFVTRGDFSWSELRLSRLWIHTTAFTGVSPDPAPGELRVRRIFGE